MKQPKSLSFEDVNDFVHSTDTEFDDLQNLCLRYATCLEKDLDQPDVLTVSGPAGDSLAAGPGQRDVPSDGKSGQERRRRTTFVPVCEFTGEGLYLYRDERGYQSIYVYDAEKWAMCDWGEVWKIECFK